MKQTSTLARRTLSFSSGSPGRKRLLGGAVWFVVTCTGCFPDDDEPGGSDAASDVGVADTAIDGSPSSDAVPDGTPPDSGPDLLPDTPAGDSAIEDSSDATPTPDPTLEVTAVFEGLEIPFDGCLERDVVVGDPGQMRLLIDADTCLRTSDGRRLTGAVFVGLDAHDPLEFGLDHEGTAISIWVEVDGAGEPGFIDATFDPPAQLMLGEGDVAQDGAWLVETIETIDGAFLGDETLPSPEDWIVRPWAMAPQPLTAASPLEVARGRVLLFSWRRPEVGSQKNSHLATHELELPPGDDPVTTWSVTSPGSTQMLACGGSLSEDVSYINLGWRDDMYWTTRIVRRDGKRFLQIVSPCNNRLFLRAQTLGEDGRYTTTTATTGGSPNEEDVDAVYCGGIEIQVSAWGGWSDYRRDVFRVIHEAAGGGYYDTVQDRFYKRGGRYMARLRVFNHPESVRRLAGRLPPDWRITYGDRELRIDVPCGLPQIVTGGPFISHIEFVDPELLQVSETVDLSFSPLDFAFTSDPDRLILMGSDGVRTLDIESGAMTDLDLDTDLDGQSTAMALDPTGELLYLVTDGGEFRAVNPTDGRTEWRILDDLPAQPATSLVVSEDGAFAYVAQPGAELVVEIDLLRHFITGPIPLPAASLAVSHSGTQLALVFPEEGGVGLVDLFTAEGGELIATGAGASSATWTTDDGRLLVTNALDDSVSLLDPDTLEITRFELPGIPTSAVVWPTEAGPEGALVGSAAGNQLHRLDLGPPLRLLDTGVLSNAPLLIRASR